MQWTGSSRRPCPAGQVAGGIHALWARRTIDDCLGATAGAEDGETVRQAVLKLALEHRLVSRYTSLVAVERTPSRPTDAELKVRGNARAAAGWLVRRRGIRPVAGTATPAPLFLVLGLASLALAGVLRRRWR